VYWMFFNSPSNFADLASSDSLDLISFFTSSSIAYSLYWTAANSCWRTFFSSSRFCIRSFKVFTSLSFASSFMRRSLFFSSRSFVYFYKFQTDPWDDFSTTRITNGMKQLLYQ
jgi:DMSO reductase anchor subunit